MIPQEISQAIMEFALRCGQVPNLETAILFGSAVDGSFSKKSDIDVLLIFDIDGNPEVGPEAEEIHRLSGEISTGHSLSHPISFVMYSKGETIERSLLREVLRNGIVLFARPSEVLDVPRRGLRAHSLISYTLKGMEPREKMGLQRGLFGYRVTRKVGDKSYQSSSPGLVGQWGRRIGPTAFLILDERAEEARELLQKRNCRFEEVPVWLETGN